MEAESPDQLIKRAQEQIYELQDTLEAILTSNVGPKGTKKFISASGELLTTLQLAREKVTQLKLGPVAITLGRSDGIAKFFAFSFLSEAKRPLREVLSKPFNGSGIYAIYYHGNGE
ncbi:MAG: hypothetical protein KDN19_15520, partial [Verrucomicrobiae bacterium]|nr:hypothetical protein [Verrucomicrobiae bacterium]